MPLTAITKPGTGQRHARGWAVLVVVGLAWGTTQLLTKLATSTDHPALGLAFWQTLIAASVFVGALRLTGRTLPAGRTALLLYLACGITGTVLPHTLTFWAIRHVPVGVQAIVISLAPMMTLLLSVAVGVDRAERRRLIGLGLGMVAVMLIVLPETSLPDPGQAGWVMLLAVVPLSYALENVAIARAQPPDMDAMQLMAGLSLAALLLVAPAVAMSGVWVPLWPIGVAEAALIGTSFLHVCAYFGLVWLIGHAGPVFASQVGYLVTGTGVALGIFVLGESHSSWVWAALALMMVGVTLVRPKARD